MDASPFLSDDDYDVVSNPGGRSLESSSEEFHFEDRREPPASDDAREKFETTRWSAAEIQLYVRKGFNLTTTNTGPVQFRSLYAKRIRVYVEGVFDSFEIRHAHKLRQAKLAFPSVHLLVGIFSDDVLQKNSRCARRPEVERAELVRHCRWVDEVVRDAPWEISLQFLNDRAIDFVAIDEGTSIDPSCDKVRVNAYDEVKKHGKIIRTRKTLGVVAQLGETPLNPSGRVTPRLSSGRLDEPNSAGHIDIYGIGF